MSTASQNKIAQRFAADTTPKNGSKPKYKATFNFSTPTVVSEEYTYDAIMERHRQRTGELETVQNKPILAKTDYEAILRRNAITKKYLDRLPDVCDDEKVTPIGRITPEQIETILTCYLNKEQVIHIAKKTRISQALIYDVLKRELKNYKELVYERKIDTRNKGAKRKNKSMRIFNDEERQNLFDLYKNGTYAPVLAEDNGVHVSTIYRILRKFDEYEEISLRTREAVLKGDLKSKGNFNKGNTL